jgi:uncharacterized protein (TIGR02145 family)
MKNVRIIILTIIMVQMNSFLAQNDNNVYLLGETEDGTKYAFRGSWVRGELGDIYLKNYCFSRIPGKFALDTARWEKCDDYAESGGILEYEILRKKFIDPNDSTKYLKSMVNVTEDSIVLVRNTTSKFNVYIESNLYASGEFYNYENGVTVELKSLQNSLTKNKEYVLSELQNEIKEINYTPYLSLSTGEVEYTATTSTSFFEPSDLGLVNAFSKRFKIISQNNGTKTLIPVVTIGNQLWMAENLSTNEFANKVVIPKQEDWNTWSALSTSAYFFNDGNKYYNQAALIDNRNICPVGFRVPNENDLIELVKTISPDQRNYVMLNKKNKLTFNLKSNDLNLNGLISNDSKTNSKKSNKSEVEFSLPTNEYLLGLNTTNKILIGNTKIDTKHTGVYLPFIYGTLAEKQILCLNYSFYAVKIFDDQSNERILLPYSTVSNENIVYFTSETSRNTNNSRYIPNIENKIGYAVRCISDK